MDGILSLIKNGMRLTDIDVRSVSSLTLAYLGDCIYELVIRTMLVEQGVSHVNDLHKKASGIVKASAQKDMFRRVEGILSEEELSVFRRGRNVKSAGIAKNATVQDYRIATGYEALMGYLYLNERYERIVELVKLGLSTDSPELKKDDFK